MRVVLLFSIFFVFSNGISVFEGDDRNACTNTQFFNAQSATCVECCPPPAVPGSCDITPTTDKLGCKCKPEFKTREDFGGNQVQCDPCPTQFTQSRDGWECVRCNSTAAPLTPANTCGSCPSQNVVLDRYLDGVKNVVGGDYVQTCKSCKELTTPNLDGDRCEYCSDVIKMDPTRTTCICPQPVVGGVCFKPGVNIPNSPSLNEIEYLTSLTIQSKLYTDTAREVYGMCQLNNMTACQSLANLCVLRLYEGIDENRDSDACQLYRSLLDSKEQQPTLGFPTYFDEWPRAMPWLWYKDVRAEDVVTEEDILNVYSMDPSTGDQSRLKLRAMRYDTAGNFLGQGDVIGSMLQLCNDSFQRLDAAYTFGMNYDITCKIPVRLLFDNPIYSTVFYDLFVEYTDNSRQMLYPVPVLVRQFKDNDGQRINNDDTQSADWQYFRRFFLVDRVTGIQSSSPTELSVIRVANEVILKVQLQPQTQNINRGRILPPVVYLNYTELDRVNYNNNHTLEVTFKVEYSMDYSQRYDRTTIAIGVLAGFALIYAAFKSWVWTKRAGRIGCDFITVMVLLMLLVYYLPNVFLVVLIGNAVYQLIFYKLQSTAEMIIDTPEQELYFTVFLSVSAFLLFLNMIILIVKQSNIDIFFIDWERPNARGDDPKQACVSSWRTILATNEWNEIQTYRKTNLSFQLLITVMMLAYTPIGLENWAHADPIGGVNPGTSSEVYRAPYSRVLRLASGFIVYIVIYALQLVFFMLFYERCVEHKLRQYVDLLSTSNISVFILENDRFGYYLHGQSVHGTADVDMKQMSEQLRREKLNLVGQRGLLANTDQQTFLIAVTQQFRRQYDKVLLPLYKHNLGSRPAGAGAASSGGQSQRLTAAEDDQRSEKSIQAYEILNALLSRFVQHSLKDLDYEVVDKPFIESILGFESRQPETTSYFYNDAGHAFESVLFYGNEMALFAFDLAMFLFFDWVAANFIVAGVTTFLLSKLFVSIRDGCARRNLAMKTLVDERFLI